jgi:predicted nuclease of predicted toxin-antitoxin system
MKVLLDECLPRKLGRLLVGHEVTTVQEAGWSGVTNG